MLAWARRCRVVLGRAPPAFPKETVSNLEQQVSFLRSVVHALYQKQLPQAAGESVGISDAPLQGGPPGAQLAAPDTLDKLAEQLDPMPRIWVL